MNTTATLAATAVAAIALAHASVASADSKYFNVTVGGPGYVVSAGSAGIGVGFYGGAPVHPAYAVPLVAPTAVYGPVYAPAPVYVAPPVAYRPYRPHRAYYAPPPVAYRTYPAYRAYAPVAPAPYRAVAPVRYVPVPAY
jgi:hypothetical protein